MIFLTHHDRIVIRQVLYLTVLFDHDVIDGAPMARFIGELSRNIENGLNLKEEGKLPAE